MVGRCECRWWAGDCDVDHRPDHVYVVSVGKAFRLICFRLQECALRFFYAYPIFCSI